MNTLATSWHNVPFIAYGPGDSALDHTDKEINYTDDVLLSRRILQETVVNWMRLNGGGVMASLHELPALAAQGGVIIDIAASDVGCHIGGSLSVIDILLYALNRYQADEHNCVVLSKGHAAAALYSALYVLGYSDTNPAEHMAAAIRC